MRTTTLRIGDELWAMLEAEAERDGVSVSQYVREAALARVAAASGSRSEIPFEQITRSAREVASSSATPDDKRRAIEVALAGLARAVAQQESESSRALRSQSRQAERQAERQTEKIRHRQPS
jgi:hypothetical protein